MTASLKWLGSVREEVQYQMCLEYLKQLLEICSVFVKNCQVKTSNRVKVLHKANVSPPYFSLIKPTLIGYDLELCLNVQYVF